MDERTFGEMTKRVASLGWVRVEAGAAQAAGVGEEAFGYCRAGGFPCGKDQQCCTNNCLDDGTCDCARKGKSCLNRVGVNCCSKKCRKGKCL